MLKLTTDMGVESCPECQGKRTVPCPPRLSSKPPNERGHFLAPGTGAPIPCPTCKGKGVVVK